MMGNALRLEILPTKTADAAANMASDLLMLEAYPAPDSLRLRAYDWSEPAFTFGYSQQFDWVVAQTGVPAGSAAVVRRPTGGGVVDHRDDWTYALVAPAWHPLSAGPATEAYALVHEALRLALADCGIESWLKPCDCEDDATRDPGPSVCFTKPEVSDIVRFDGTKIAGAALKRNPHGLLLQGSVSRAAAVQPFAGDTLRVRLAYHLCAALGTVAVPVSWPDWREEFASVRERFASPAWNARR